MNSLLPIAVFTFATLAFTTGLSSASSSVQFTTQVMAQNKQQVHNPQVDAFAPAQGAAWNDFYFGVVCADKISSWFYIDKENPPVVNKSNSSTAFEFTNGKDEYKFEVDTGRYAYPSLAELNENVANPFCKKPDRIIRASRFQKECRYVRDESGWRPDELVCDRFYYYELSCANGSNFKIRQTTGDGFQGADCSYSEDSHDRVNRRGYTVDYPIGTKGTCAAIRRAVMGNSKSVAEVTRAFDEQIGKKFCS